MKKKLRLHVISNKQAKEAVNKIKGAKRSNYISPKIYMISANPSHIL